MIDSGTGGDLLAKAREFLASGDPEAAEKECREVLKGRPMSPDDLVLLGQILMAKDLLMTLG